MTNFSEKSEARLAKVHPDIARLMRLAREKSPIPFEISQGLRTPEEQKALYAQGRTTKGPIVTWTMESRHLTGHAVDVVVIIGGKAVWDEEVYTRLADHILGVAASHKIHIVWGGTFTNGQGKPRPDRPHYELNRAFY